MHAHMIVTLNTAILPPQTAPPPVTEETARHV
jgi:hypothetical protein